MDSLAKEPDKYDFSRKIDCDKAFSHVPKFAFNSANIIQKLFNREVSSRSKILCYELRPELIHLQCFFLLIASYTEQRPRCLYASI